MPLIYMHKNCIYINVLYTLSDVIWCGWEVIIAFYQPQVHFNIHNINNLTWSIIVSTGTFCTSVCTSVLYPTPAWSTGGAYDRYSPSLTLRWALVCKPSSVTPEWLRRVTFSVLNGVGLCRSSWVCMGFKMEERKTTEIKYINIYIII